jgi:uncharacterized RDD family membrane protein YckC
MQTEIVAEELLTFEEDYVRAESGKRLANLLIDNVLSGILYFIFGFVLTGIFPSLIDILTDPNGGYRVIDFVFSTLFYALYMGSVEAIFKGKSLGKLITGTRAVNIDGTYISTTTAFQRGLPVLYHCARSAHSDLPVIHGRISGQIRW